MSRTNGPIKVWSRTDTTPTDSEGGYAGGDSTAAAVARVEGEAGVAAFIAAWDGPVHRGPAAPADTEALWIDGQTVRQYDPSPDTRPTNHARQTATHSTTGISQSIVTNLRMESGRVTGTTGTGSGARISVSDTAYGVAVTPGQSLTMSADLGGGGAGHNSSYAIRIVWHDAAGTIVASKTGAYAALDSGGQRRSLTETVPAGIAFACLHMVSMTAAGVIADIWITRISATFDGSVEYISGDTPGYQWTGDPGLSVSEPIGAGPWFIVTSVNDLTRQKTSTSAAIAAAPDEQLAHDVRRATLRRRRGGPIGVGDKQVVAVRLDHGVQEAHDKGILDALVDLGIPYHLCTCPEPDPSVVAEDPVPWDIVRSAAATGGAEIGNHSRTHALDASGTAALTSEIVGGLTGVQAQVPDQAIEVWTQPGLSESGTMYDGWKHGRDIESITTTEAGRLILGHHGAVMGALSQQYWMPLDGTEAVGLAAWFADGKRPYQVQNHITAARSYAPALGGVIAMHPAWLDRGGNYQTTAECIEWLTWLAAERDAGRVELLTHAGLSVATARDTIRPALATASGPAPITATPHQGAMGSLARAPYGAMWQAVAEVTATIAGDVTLTAECGDNTTAVTVTLAADETATLRRHVLLPLDATDTPTATVTGAATVADLRIQSA